MTLQKAEAIAKDYNGGDGLSLKELCWKYKLSHYIIRTTLIRQGVYVPRRKLYETFKITEQSNAWKLAHAEKLLNKVLFRHEGGLLPDRLLYLEIKDYFKNKNDNNYD